MTAEERFTIELAKVSKRGSRHLRGLQKADREDVIAAAILNCWEDRDSFKPNEESLDKWFAKHLKAARRAFKHQHFVAVEELNNLSAIEQPERDAEVAQAVEQMAAELTADERKVAVLLGKGHTLKAIAEELTWLSRSDFKAIMLKLQRLRDLLPEEAVERQYTKESQRADTDREQAPIDHEIARMLVHPSSNNSDCPICWRCSWYDGWLPVRYKPTKIADEELRTAVHSIEARKIQIAHEVRSSN